MKGFINLGKKNERIAIAMPEEEKDVVSYPSFYINDIDLGLDDKDLNDEMEATVKLKMTRHTMTKENGKIRHSCDFEIMGIKFND